MAEVLASVTEVFTAGMGWVGTVGTSIMGTPILAIGVISGFIGIGIGLFSRLLHV